MKSLKKRFTQWFNRVHLRKGTLWEDRYRSTIVEHEDWEKDGSWETDGSEEKKRAVTGPAEL